MLIGNLVVTKGRNHDTMRMVIPFLFGFTVQSMRSVQVAKLEALRIFYWVNISLSSNLFILNVGNVDTASVLVTGSSRALSINIPTIAFRLVLSMSAMCCSRCRCSGLSVTDVFIIMFSPHYNFELPPYYTAWAGRMELPNGTF